MNARLDLIGRDIGPYRVLSLLGAGGMGEVYRARDNKLGRDVAIKVLPGLFAADPDRLARFGREARLLASLNHPHIGSIYGFEESDHLHALVLELVEGPTVAEKLTSGPIGVGIEERDQQVDVEQRDAARCFVAGPQHPLHAARLRGPNGHPNAAAALGTPPSPRRARLIRLSGR